VTSTRVLEVDARPPSTRAWFEEVWRHRAVLRALAKTDFHVRYKRASFGIAWAVLLPLVQAGVLAVVFSKVLSVRGGAGFAAFVLSGVTAWGYFQQTLSTASTAIVEGSGLTDKVWFPRALLPLAPAAANTIGLLISIVLLLALTPVLGGHLGVSVLWLVPGVLLLAAFTASLAMALAALHVYFRDVRFIVQAVLLVWFYVTPVLYPPSYLGNLRWILSLNPMAGVVALFHAAVVDVGDGWMRSVAISAATTAVLGIAVVATYRRHDRLFVDQL
jgi:ABC-type polysaccharide/polyol phosphate export permease